MDKTINAISKILSSRGKTICTIESCTGGSLASLLTSVSGASSYFMGGLIPYSDQTKNQVLKIKKDTLKKYGAVSAETSQEMLINGLRLFKTDYGISTTGFAGPTGGTEQYPIGTIVVSYGSLTDIHTHILSLSGSREENISQTQKQVLGLFLKYLQKFKN
ncbi:CinA family protein [Candidatus Nomurabacteria bacterium]|nr:CinA family protein [Candidatus Nomurabacteria bacterium]